MNYKHLYHAGNFCDVFKHIVLISLMDFLKKKDKPFCYFETHAGAGGYDLNTLEAQKTLEYKNGIQKLFELYVRPQNSNLEAQKIPNIVESYLKIVKETGFPNYYPGSPLIAQSALRSSDNIILTELNSIEAEALKRLFYGNKQVAVHCLDGYQGLKAFLPPKERRGLIHIDPPYEKASEWTDLIKHLDLALKRFPMGVYAIWYPLKDKVAISKFHSDLQVLNKKNLEIVVTELSIYPDDIIKGLIGSGMVIINPPWEWSKTFSDILPWLWKVLSVNRQGAYRIFSL